MNLNRKPLAKNFCQTHRFIFEIIVFFIFYFIYFKFRVKRDFKFFSFTKGFVTKPSLQFDTEVIKMCELIKKNWEKPRSKSKRRSFLKKQYICWKLYNFS